MEKKFCSSFKKLTTFTFSHGSIDYSCSFLIYYSSLYLFQKKIYDNTNNKTRDEMVIKRLIDQRYGTKPYHTYKKVKKYYYHKIKLWYIRKNKKHQIKNWSTRFLEHFLIPLVSQKCSRNKKYYVSKTVYGTVYYHKVKLGKSYYHN